MSFVASLIQTTSVIDHEVAKEESSRFIFDSSFLERFKNSCFREFESSKFLILFNQGFKSEWDVIVPLCFSTWIVQPGEESSIAATREAAKYFGAHHDVKIFL